MAEQPTPFATLRGLLTGSARGQAPATAPVVTAGAAQTAPVLPQQPVQQETSLLEQLRERVQRDISPGPMSGPERLAAFGRGVLSNRGSFLDNLTAGLAAQGQAETARREEGRKAAELEAAIAERDRRAQLEKAKFSEETTPGTLSARLKEAQIAKYLSDTSEANRDRPVAGMLAENPTTGTAMQYYSRSGFRDTGIPFANFAGQQSAYERAMTTWQRTRDQAYASIDATIDRQLAIPTNMARADELERRRLERKEEWNRNNPPPRAREGSAQSPSQTRSEPATTLAPQENRYRTQL